MQLPIDGEIGSGAFVPSSRSKILDHVRRSSWSKCIMKRGTKRFSARGGKINDGFLLECVHLARRSKEAVEQGRSCRRNTEPHERLQRGISLSGITRRCISEAAPVSNRIVSNEEEYFGSKLAFSVWLLLHSVGRSLIFLAEVNL